MIYIFKFLHFLIFLCFDVMIFFENIKIDDFCRFYVLAMFICLCIARYVYVKLTIPNVNTRGNKFRLKRKFSVGVD